MSSDRPVDTAPLRIDSDISAARAELARFTNSFFAGAPVYDLMVVAESKLFHLIRREGFAFPYTVKEPFRPWKS